VSSPFAGRTAGDGRAVGRAGRAARVRRGMFLLPSLFTAGSIGAGYFAITQTIDSLTAPGNGGGANHLDWAAIAICFAIPFDALDGRIARMTNTTSDFGKELDSLADAITFGVAPCLLAWVWGFHSLPEAMNPQLQADDTSDRVVRLLPVSALRGVAAGAIQYQPRSAAAKPWEDGPEVFCRNADSGCRWNDRVHGSFLLRVSDSLLVAGGALDRAGGAARVPDGEHVAILVGQRDQFWPEAAVPTADGACDHIVRAGPLLKRGAVFCGAGVHVLGNLGARGIFMVAAEAAYAAG
jgi:hypothetical protein